MFFKPAFHSRQISRALFSSLSPPMDDISKYTNSVNTSARNFFQSCKSVYTNNLFTTSTISSLMEKLIIMIALKNKPLRAPIEVTDNPAKDFEELPVRAFINRYRPQARMAGYPGN